MIRKKRVIKVQALLLSMLMILTFLVPIDTIRASAEGSDQTQNTDIVRTLSLSYLLKGESQFTELQSPYHIEDASKISKYHAKYSFTLNDNIDENGSPARTMAAGD